MYSSLTKKVKKQNSFTIRLHNGSAVVVDLYLLHSGEVFASGHSVEIGGAILQNRVPHNQKMIMQHPSVVKITSLREPISKRC